MNRPQRRVCWWLPLLAALSGCGANAVAHPHSADSESAHSKPKRPLPRDVVMRSAKPFYGLRSGKKLDDAELAAALKENDVVCVGEQHDDPEHHYVQLRVISLLASHAESAGEMLGVGFEMFRRPAQDALTQFESRQLDEAGFLKASDYKNSWGFDFSLYRPLLELARDHDAKLIALNAPRDWTKQVAKRGLDGLNDELRAQLPELKLDDPEHRQFFQTAMGAHPGSSAEPEGAAKGETQTASNPHAHAMPPDMLEKFYAAQVVWDETMAEGVAQFFDRRTPGPDAAAGHEEQQPKRRMIVLAGAGHCHRSAIPRRVERRTGRKVLSVRAIQKRQLGKSQAPSDEEFDLLLVIAD